MARYSWEARSRTGSQQKGAMEGANKGVVESGKVDPNLMGPPRFEFDLEE